MKKTISWVSTAVLGLSLLIPANNIRAYGPIGAEADNTDLTAGGTVTITCRLPEEAGFQSFDINISYPEAKLNVTETKTNSIYEQAYIKAEREEAGSAGVLVADRDVITDGGEVFVITFEAAAGATGSAMIKVDGTCTRPDSTSEQFGQVFTVILPSGGGSSNTATSAPASTSKPTATPKASTGGGGGGSSSASATDAPLSTPTAVPTATPTAKPTATPKPTAEPVNFTDISAHWAKDSITELAAQGYINGFDDNTFRPEENVTRAQFIKMLSEVKGLNTSLSLTVFDDVPEDAWFAPYVTAAAANGIVKGDDENNFHPDSPITRQEMAVMCARAFDFAASNNTEFTDNADIADWAKDSVSALVSENIINGFEEDNTFRPLNNTSRAQAAVVLRRITDK